MENRKKQNITEAVWKGLFLIMAAVSILAVAAILIFLLAEGFPAIAEIGLFKFVFGREWRPVAGLYGILPMIVGSIYSTAGALIIGGSLGIFTAIFLAKFCPEKLKKALTQLVNLLAGIPSIVYGTFGYLVLSRFIGQMSSNGSGSGILLVSIILGIMILPTVAALSKTSIEAVDKSYYEAAVALGATHEQAVFKVVVPAAKSGITASVILGAGRAVGETMAVVMVAGNQAVFPASLTQSFRTMTSGIVLEMGYASGLHKGALIATGVILLFFILIINTLFGLIKNGGKEKKGGFGAWICKVFRASGKTRGMKAAHDKPIKEASPAASVFFTRAGKYLSFMATGIGVAALFGIVIFIFIKGVPHITGHLLFGEMTSLTGPPTIFPSIVATLMVVFMTSIIAFPIGIFAAIFLSEYTKKGSRAVKLIRYGVDTLAAIPSIVFALFGLLFFSGFFGLGQSVWAGCLTITLMIIPTTVRATEEALISVPDSFREGSYALGGGKVRTIYKVVLPSAMPGILASVILGIGRMIGESAPFLFTMGGSLKPAPAGYGSGGTTLAVAVYALAREARYTNEAYATACVLIVLVLGLNLLSTFAGTRLQNRLTGNKLQKGKG